MKISILNDNSFVLGVEKIANHTVGLTCPKCDSIKFNKNGKVKKRQRYICKNCRSTFGDTINTPIHRIRKPKLLVQYIEALYEGQSIRRAAKNIGISIKTSFQWRHKLLSSINKPVQSQSNGLVAVEELKMPYSRKGARKKENTCPRYFKSLLFYENNSPLRIVQISTRKSGKDITSKIQESISQNMLVSKNSKSLTNAILKSGKQKVRIPDLNKYFLDKLEHAKLRIKEWFVRFRGVATKYIAQYWGWFYCQQQIEEQTLTVKRFAKLCLGHRNLEHYYKLIAQ